MKNICFLLLLLLLTLSIWGQEANNPAKDTLAEQSQLGPVSDTIPNINIFGESTPLRITLKYDITSFVRNKSKGEYLDAELQIYYSESELITKNIRVKARGKFRNGQCIFPPIYLNFKTDPLENTELKEIKKMKLVTHCSSSKGSESNVLKEYLAYKMYNVLTDNSFKVRLLNITYIDTGKKQKIYQKYGFVIEPLELLCKRRNSIIIEPTIIRQENILEEFADKVALFQYMIGNTDWRFKSGHNTDYIKDLNIVTDKVIPVPYDFDFSGLVNAYYSYPQTWTSIEKVTDREYLGYCRNSNEAYLKNINYFIEKKEEIFKTIEKFEYLDEKEKKSVSSFIESFYNKISRPENFIQTLKSECRTEF